MALAVVTCHHGRIHNCLVERLHTAAAHGSRPELNASCRRKLSGPSPHGVADHLHEIGHRLTVAWLADELSCTLLHVALIGANRSLCEAEKPIVVVVNQTLTKSDSCACIDDS